MTSPLFLQYREAVTRRCSVKKVFLDISQNSQENTYARASFLIKLQAWRQEHLRTPFYIEQPQATASEYQYHQYNSFKIVFVLYLINATDLHYRHRIKISIIKKEHMRTLNSKKLKISRILYC